MEGGIEMVVQEISSRSNSSGLNRNANSTRKIAKKGMVLPFTPLAMSFDKVIYYVDMPPVRLKHHFTFFTFVLVPMSYTPYSLENRLNYLKFVLSWSKAVKSNTLQNVLVPASFFLTSFP